MTFVTYEPKVRESQDPLRKGVFYIYKDIKNGAEVFISEVYSAEDAEARRKTQYYMHLREVLSCFEISIEWSIEKMPTSDQLREMQEQGLTIDDAAEKALSLKALDLNTLNFESATHDMGEPGLNRPLAPISREGYEKLKECGEGYFVTTGGLKVRPVELSSAMTITGGKYFLEPVGIAENATRASYLLQEAA